jgi:gamma-glutamylcyclotransferase (GGCT)/AIG2-like uncharacterized protein YtfP
MAGPASDEEGGAEDHLVFVYGSLKRGGTNHDLLRGATFEGERALEGLEMWDTGEGFPACVPGEGTVHGEVYTVDDATLMAVDRLEGVPDLYERRRTEGLWVYVWAGDPKEGWGRVPDGRWDVGAGDGGRG